MLYKSATPIGFLPNRLPPLFLFTRGRAAAAPFHSKLLSSPPPLALPAILPVRRRHRHRPAAAALPSPPCSSPVASPPRSIPRAAACRSVAGRREAPLLWLRQAPPSLVPSRLRPSASSLTSSSYIHPRRTLPPSLLSFPSLLTLETDGGRAAACRRPSERRRLSSPSTATPQRARHGLQKATSDAETHEGLQGLIHAVQEDAQGPADGPSYLMWRSRDKC